MNPTQRPTLAAGRWRDRPTRPDGLGVSRRGVLAAGLSTTMVAVAGCGDTDLPEAPPPVRELTVLTGFGLLGQDAYLYAGTSMGYFTQAGLKVTVRAGAGTAANLGLLAAGKADAAVVDLSGALQAYGAGHRHWVTIAALYQRSVSCILSPAGTGIDRPRDLAGKTIGYQPGGVNHTLFPTYAKLAGLDPDAVRWQAVPPPQLRAALAAGRVDAITETVIGAAGTQAVIGRPVSVLPYSEVLSDLYGNVLVVGRRLLHEQPDMIGRFRTALLAALRYVIEQPERAGTIFHQHQPAYRAQTATAENRLMAPYVNAPGGDPIGSLDPVRVARTIALLKGAGAMNGDADPDQVVAFDLARPRPATTT